MYIKAGDVKVGDILWHLCKVVYIRRNEQDILKKCVLLVYEDGTSAYMPINREVSVRRDDNLDKSL